MATTATAPITHTQDELLERIRGYLEAGDTRVIPLTWAINRATAVAIPLGGSAEAEHFPQETPDRATVLDGFLAHLDVAANAARNLAGTFTQTAEWLHVLGHLDAEADVLSTDCAATKAYHELCGEIAVAVQATHACDQLLPVVQRAVQLATEAVGTDDVYGLLVDAEEVDNDPKTRVLVRLALLVLADSGSVREPEPGKYLPAA